MGSAKKNRASSLAAAQTEAAKAPVLSPAQILDKKREEIAALRTKLDGVTKPIKNELDAAEATLRQLEQEAKEVWERDFVTALQDNPQLIALLRPKHDFTSCSDENPANEQRGCSRCVLVVARDSGCWNDDYGIYVVRR